MLDFIKLFDKILSTNINHKNYSIVVFILVLTSLYILDFDINQLYNIKNGLITVIILNILINIILNLITSSKLSQVYDNAEKIDSLSNSIETNIILFDKMNKNVDNIFKIVNEHDKKMEIVTNELSNKPNLKLTKLLIDYDIRNLLNDIFVECLNYTLISNENNNNIVLSTLKDKINYLLDDVIDTIHKNIKNFENNETLSNEIKTELLKLIDIVTNDIQTNKAVNEKLYIINCLLRNYKIEIEKITIKYLRNIQTQIFD